MGSRYATLASWPSVSFSRRCPRSYCYVLLAILSVLIFSSVLTQRHEHLPYFSPGFKSDLDPPRSVVIRPGDLVSDSREVRPQDDNAPFAHEPKGLGTLRDVREDKFYRGGTLTLADGNGDHSRPIPSIYDPYPDSNGDNIRACKGPRGNVLSRKSAEDMISVYRGLPKDFPPPLLGSYEATGLDAYICTDRHSRLGAYGYSTSTKINWDEVNWGSLQSQCLQRNGDRYTPQANLRQIKDTLPAGPPSARNTLRRPGSSSGFLYKKRSAVILRAWQDMEWTENLKQNIRALLMELSLHSGAEYNVFILYHMKDRNVPIYTDDEETMRSLKEQFIPHEFWDLTVFFNDQTLESWYPKIEEHRTMYQYWQPVQIFSQLFPEFDYYWQLETDSRFTGHVYHFLEQSAHFAKKQPRKYLWERNAYFYIPGAHGTWQNFLEKVDSSMNGRESIWGPKNIPQIIPVGPKPPVTSPQEDNYKWGVGEEADLITFFPTFNPVNTHWTFPNNLWGIPEDVPRQASPIAIGRISNTLVQQMHNLQVDQGIGLASEMTAPSLALWHGLKAVHVPHPLYVDGKWTPKELERILNPGPPEKINGGDESIWNWDHILYRFSFMFSTQTAEDFYRRWLGYKIDPGQYTDGSYHQDPQGRNWFESGDLREDLYGPLCFPTMLIHTVKNTAEKKGSDMAVPI